MRLLPFLLVFLQNQTFKRGLELIRSSEFEKADSLLMQSYFEADQLDKNDILMVIEILNDYRDPSDLKFLSGYYLALYFGENVVPHSYSTQEKNSLITYVELLNALQSKPVDISVAIQQVEMIDDPLLNFHGAILVVRKFKDVERTACRDLIQKLVKEYPQTPYSEVVQGYLEILK